MSQPIENRSRNRLVAAALLALTFLFGLAAGAIGDRMVLFHQHRLMPSHGFRFVSSHILKRLDRELDLSPQQEKEVGAILERQQKSIEGVWSGVRPQIRQQIDRSTVEIESKLNPEQRVKFAKLRQQWKDRARAIAGP